MAICPIDISHTGTVLNPVSLFTLLTSLTNNSHVHRLLFHNDELETELDFLPSLNVFTQQELATISKKPSSFCHFHGSNSQGIRAWLSVCNPDKMELIMHSPSAGFKLDHADGYFRLISSVEDNCDLLGKSMRTKRDSEFRITDPAYVPHTVPHYYKNFSHLFERKRYIELAFLGDSTFYQKYGKDEATAKERMRSIVHMANSFFHSIRIEIQLVHLNVYKSTEEMSIDFSGEDTLFPSWRKFVETFGGVHYDHIMLITPTAGVDDPYSGLANYEAICDPERSISWIVDSSADANREAGIFAHELGHSLGMDHDRESADFAVCECPISSCIQKAGDPVHPRHWSNCSLGSLDIMYKSGADYCLWNDPRDGTIEEASCGNGILEAGEECDCGADECLLHDCCDPSTCKLRDGAQCADGTCCDLGTCSIVTNRTRVCRNAASTCDHPEFCDGVSSECPEDLIYENGEPCPDDMEAMCYNGRCGSRQLQCKQLWGAHAPPANESCYDLNLGNEGCGWGKECEKENVQCGVLYCNAGQEAASLFNRGWYLEEWGSGSDCRSMLVRYQADYVPDYHIGMTPDGTSCGDGKFCLDRKCVPKTELLGCQLKYFHDETGCEMDKDCTKPLETGTALTCGDGFGLQAELVDGSWINLSSVTCVKNKYEIVTENKAEMSLNAVGFRCKRNDPVIPDECYA